MLPNSPHVKQVVCGENGVLDGVKAGSIIPMQKLVESTAENPGDTLFVHIYSGGSNNRFVYYEDDGETYNYANGNFYKRAISYYPESKSIEMDGKAGSLPSKFKMVTLMMHGFQTNELGNLKVNGASAAVGKQEIRFFTSHFKFADYGPFDYKTVTTVSFQNTDNKITINW